MKISSINNYSNYNGKQNFKGLWGKTSIKTDIDSVWNVPQVTETRYYYPFIDENPSDVNKIINERKHAEIINNYTKYRVYDCKKGMELPFNSQQYEAYLKINDSLKCDNVIKKMHELIRDKYINDDIGKRQKPAYNPIVEEKSLNH